MNRSIRHPKYLAAVATLALCLPLLVQAQSAAGSATTAAPSVSQPAVPPYAGQETHQGHGMHRGTHHGMHHGMHHGKHARDEGHGMGEGMHLLRGLKLSAAQRDQVFGIMARGSRDYDPTMQLEGVTGAIGTTGTGDRQEAMLSVLKPEQRAVYQAEQQRRRDETAKTLDGIGLTLPADWDMLNDY